MHTRRLFRALAPMMALISGVAGLASTCHSAEGVDLGSPPAVSRWPTGPAWQEMLASWYRGGRVTVVVDASTPAELEAYRRAVAPRDPGAARAPGAWSIPARIIAASEATAPDLTGPLLLLGAGGSRAASNLRRTPIAAMLPLRPREVVRVMSVNPWDPDAAMMILSGPDDAAVRDYLDRTARGWGVRGIEYEFQNDGMRVCYGRFAPNPGGAWRIDPAGSVDLRDLVSTKHSGGVTARYLRGELSDDQVRETSDAAWNDLRDFVSRLGGSQETTRLELVLYPDRETKAVRTGDPRLSHCETAADGASRVHAVAAGTDNEFADRIALARAALAGAIGGLERGALADGTALWLAGGMLGRSLDWWGARLDRSGLRMPSDEILDPAVYDRRSYLIGMPSAGLMVREMVEGMTPLQVKALLGDISKARRAASAMPRRDRKPSLLPGHESSTGALRGVGSFQKGMSLSHEGYAVTDGYGSAAAVGQMRRLADMGVDWISLSPYGFMRDPTDPEIAFLQDEEQSPGTENDMAVLSSLRSAHRMGLKVMLKPQIWLSRGHWTGDVAMATSESWQQFFTRYREFLAHYALLAEAGGADLLVIGVELQQTTLREAEWRALIAVARALYAGPLTYAANWGEEFEKVKFWDALDHAGLDCYYPLVMQEAGADEAAAPQTNDAPLLEGARRVARRVAEVARRSGRSVILTEVGFPALAQAWRAPHDENTGAAREAETQARCYRAVLAAFWEEPWLAGVFWWKWPTTPPGARREPLFSPRGNPAERVVAEWYAKPRPPAAYWPTNFPDWSRPIGSKP